MQRDPDPAVEAARRDADARRAAVLALSKSERLRLLAELCRQAAVVPQRRPRP